MPHEQNSWTIHGIWPNKNHSMGPFFCNKTWSFDPDQVKSIETDLEESWGNIEKGQCKCIIILLYEVHIYMHT